MLDHLHVHTKMPIQYFAWNTGFHKEKQPFHYMLLPLILPLISFIVYLFKSFIQTKK